MITILLATCNGERFLREQLDSLLAQTVMADRIVISDDGSTDGTCGIIAEYVASYPALISARKNEAGKGAWRNFLGMMCKERDDYIMLCDQDDVWLPEKTERTLDAMKSAENEHGTGMPLVAHTDLMVVDGSLNVLSRSLRKRMNADYSRTQLKDLIIQNTLTGCTAMYNRSLADLVMAVPEYCVMHDWWLMLIAACFGKIVTLYEPTILYRQHGGNEIGSKDMHAPSYLIKRAFSGNEVRAAIAGTYRQAESFLAVYGDRLPYAHREFLKEYTGIPNHGKCVRLRKLHSLGVRKNGLVRQIGQLLYS